METKTPVVLDIETDGRGPHEGELLLAGWCYLGQPAQVLEYPVDSAELRDVLADPQRPVVEMTKFDARYLRLQGWEIAGPIYDLQVMAWVLNENQQLSLEALMRRYRGHRMNKRLRRSAGRVYFSCDCPEHEQPQEYPLTGFRPSAGPHWRAFVEYCRRDVEAEAALFEALWRRLEATTWLEYYLEEEVPFTSVLLDMEVRGMPINLQDSEELRKSLEATHEQLGQELLREGGLPPSFKLTSGEHLAAYLYQPVVEMADSIEVDEDTAAVLESCLAGEHEYCDPYHVVDLLPSGFTARSVGKTRVRGVWVFPGRDLPATEKTPTGTRWSVSTNVLKANPRISADPWCQKLFRYRKLDKVLTTYLRRYPELAWPRGPNARLYGRFNQTGTKTGRLSSSEPNLQNQPARGELGARLRQLFQGKFIVGDYSQLEPRLMAHFSKDPRLLAVFRSGQDVYADLAHAIFGEVDDVKRDIAKTLVLAMGYGAGAAKVGSILTINGFPTDLRTAEQYLDELQRYYSRFFAWRDYIIREAQAVGHVKTLAGRYRRLRASFDDARWRLIGYGERQAVNAVIQGSAGDIVRRVMVAWHRGTPWCLPACLRQGYDLIAQVHDELVWEANDHAASCGCDAQAPEYLKAMKMLAEHEHGFDLSVPLVFEPHFGTSWRAAKEGIELPEDVLDKTDSDDG